MVARCYAFAIFLIIFTLIFVSTCFGAEVSCKTTYPARLKGCTIQQDCDLVSHQCIFQGLKCEGKTTDLCPSGGRLLCDGRACTEIGRAMRTLNLSSFVTCDLEYSCPSSQCAKDQSSWEARQCNPAFNPSSSFEPACLTYKVPCDRVIFNPTRECIEGNARKVTYTPGCEPTNGCYLRYSEETLQCKDGRCKDGQCLDGKTGLLSNSGKEKISWVVKSGGPGKNASKQWAPAGFGWGPAYCVCSSDSKYWACSPTRRYTVPSGGLTICTASEFGKVDLSGKDCSLYPTGMAIKTAISSGKNYRCVEKR